MNLHRNALATLLVATSLSSVAGGAYAGPLSASIPLRDAMSQSVETVQWRGGAWRGGWGGGWRGGRYWGGRWYGGGWGPGYGWGDYYPYWRRYYPYYPYGAWGGYYP